MTAVGAGSALTYAYFFDEGVWRTMRVLRLLLPVACDCWLHVCRAWLCAAACRWRELVGRVACLRARTCV